MMRYALLGSAKLVHSFSYCEKCVVTKIKVIWYQKKEFKKEKRKKEYIYDTHERKTIDDGQ
jgi:hypothetical protein